LTGLLDDLFGLEGKTALVVGGHKGIGRVFSDTYAMAGANVVVAARTLDACRALAALLEQKYGVRTTACAMDVRDVDSVRSVVDEVVGEYGSIDILVNSAGIGGSEAPVIATLEKDLDDLMEVNFRGTFSTCRAVAPHMKERRSGHIINVSSVLGRIAAKNLAPYCSSKAAVNQLTKVLALELAAHNVSVNALCFGYFLTDLNRDFFDSDTGRAMVKRMIPLQRLGDLGEIRSTALYVATCPPFLTGAELLMDGGHSIQ
jgi:NAD(P)-dependent dehydrogenase (short-subunit alcohol dehydrogenase family)